MTQTLIALLFAHAAADFLFQTKWMVDNKRKPGPFLAHIAVVFFLSLLVLGGAIWPAAIVTLLHLIIDFAKVRIGKDDLGAFLIDQALHLVSLVIVASIYPLAFETSPLLPLLPVAPVLPQALTIATGAILAVRMGQFLVAKLMTPLIDGLDDAEGLENGGAVIGILERGLTFILVLAGQAAGVGFLIAAKSFLRVGTIEKNRKMAEYVIIGTLASIGWALLLAFATKGVLTLLENGANLN